MNFLTVVKEKRSKLVTFMTTMCFMLLAAVPCFAEEVSGDVGTTLLESFTSGVEEIKTLLLGIVGIVMTIIVLKLAFKAGVNFFKSAANK